MARQQLRLDDVVATESSWRLRSAQMSALAAGTVVSLLLLLSAYAAPASAGQSWWQLT